MSADLARYAKRGAPRLGIFLAWLLPAGTMSAATDTELIALSTNAEAVAAGEAVYQTACFSCHGLSLEGGTGFNLRDGEWLHGGNPSQIYASVQNGFPEKGMVAYGAVYDESTLEQVVAYLLSHQIGFRKLRYRSIETPPATLKIEQVSGVDLDRTSDIPSGYMDVSVPESERFAMVFEGMLLTPKSGDFFLKVAQAIESELRVEVDGVAVPGIEVGNREYQFPVKNGAQIARVSYLKQDDKQRARFYLKGETLYEPLSLGARNEMANTLYAITPAEMPIVLRKKVENLPPRSISVGYPGSLNFSFSPVTNSIVGLWEGGFLNIGPNIQGRGKAGSRILGSWIFYDSPGIQVLIDREPLEGAFIKYSTGSAPQFVYADGKRRIRVTGYPEGLNGLRFQFDLEGFGRKRIALRVPEGLNATSADGAILGGRLIIDKNRRTQFSLTVSGSLSQL